LITLGEIAARCGGEIRGGPETKISGVTTLKDAKRGCISFLSNPSYRKYLGDTRAAAVILAPDDAKHCVVPALVSANPYALYARVAALLAPARVFAAGVHPAATVSAGARLAEGVWVGAGAVIEDGVAIAAGSFIGPGSVLGAGVTIGADTRLVANVSICHGAVIGARCLIQPGVVIGADGFGIAWENERWIKVPQLGGVVIGDDVEIGANTTIDRGALDDTVIEDDVKLDNQIQIGHNVRIGAHTAIAGCVGISGSTRIGRRCMIGGQVGFVGHLEIADNVVIYGKTLVSHSIRRAGTYAGCVPIDDAAKARRNAARMRQLDDMARRLKAIEKKLKEY
jgi:UDP-3-O-[3-hydroxymyristoyl] glucosamine N-acyltransferase